MTQAQTAHQDTKQQFNQLAHLAIIIENINEDTIALLELIFDKYELKTLQLFTNNEPNYQAKNIRIKKLNQGRKETLTAIKEIALSSSQNNIEAEDLDLIIKFGDPILNNTIIIAAAYAEIYFIKDGNITLNNLETAISDYQLRQRNFGA